MNCMQRLIDLKNYSDKPSSTRVKGLIKQLGDNSLLAIGTVVPPIRQDEDEGRE